MTTLTPAKLPRSTTPHILTLNQSGAHSLSLTSVYQAVQGKGIVNAHREYVDVDTLEQSDLVCQPFLACGEEEQEEEGSRGTSQRQCPAQTMRVRVPAPPSQLLKF